MRQSVLSQNINRCKNMKTLPCYHSYVQCYIKHPKQWENRIRSDFMIYCKVFQFPESGHIIPSNLWATEYRKLCAYNFEWMDNVSIENHQQNQTAHARIIQPFFRMPMKPMKTLKWILMRWAIYRPPFELSNHTTSMRFSLHTIHLNEFRIEPKN